MEQELLTLPEYLSSPPVFSEVRVTRSLVLCVCFVYGCLYFCTCSFIHCVVCSSSIYGSDYAYGIFKLFLQLIVIVHCKLISVREKKELNTKTILAMKQIKTTRVRVLHAGIAVYRYLDLVVITPTMKNIKNK